MGVGIDTIGRTLETLLGGRDVTRFKQAGEQYNVVVQLDPAARATPQDLTALYVRGNGRQPDAAVQPGRGHRNRRTEGTQPLRPPARRLISANIAPGYTLGEALAFMDQAARETLPKTTRTALDGQSREFGESGQTLVITFALALIVIYLVLAAQFESFISPFIIMLTVPLAATGALLALKLTGATLNVYSQIGLVMLVGLITKHGILIVEFANQLRERGKNQGRSRDRSRQPAPAADPDDHRRDGAGGRAAGTRQWRRGRIALAHRLGHRRRPAARHPVDAVRDPGCLYPADA